MLKSSYRNFQREIGVKLLFATLFLWRIARYIRAKGKKPQKIPIQQPIAELMPLGRVLTES